MRKSLLLTGLLGFGFSLPAAVMAEDAPAAPAAPAAEAAPAPDWTFPSSVSLVSDYIFRGQTQTWHKPAAQISIEADHKSGLYAGFFASNVSDQWLPGANLETDWYAGFRGAFASTDFGYDVGAIYYYYPGADWDDSGFNPPAYPAGTTKSNSLNTAEVYAAVSYKTFSLKGGRTLTEYWGWNNNNSGPGVGFAGDPSAGVKPGGNTNGSYYFETNGSYEIFPTWTISGQIGRQWISDASGLDITYHKLGITKAFSTGWSVGAFYSGTNTPDAYDNFLSLRNTTSKDDIAKNTGFVSVTKAF
jgi:uncharacterized protein (TIGR02001 family)